MECTRGRIRISKSVATNDMYLLYRIISKLYHKHLGAGEARRAHNPEVRRSKLWGANLFIFRKWFFDFQNNLVDQLFSSLILGARWKSFRCAFSIDPYRKSWQIWSSFSVLVGSYHRFAIRWYFVLSSHRVTILWVCYRRSLGFHYLFEIEDMELCCVYRNWLK